MTIHKRNIIGVVLCGGKSVRMGTDKGMLRQESTPWAQMAANKLRSLDLKVILSVNEQQAELYSVIFAGLCVIKDDTALQVFGPLKGILSVHLQYPDHDLLVLACDMPAMETEAIEYLVNLSESKKEEAFVFKDARHSEPLCAIYTSAGLRKVYEKYKHGQLLKHSLQYVLGTLETFHTIIPQEWQAYFNNYNSPDDLKESPL